MVSPPKAIGTPLKRQYPPPSPPPSPQLPHKGTYPPDAPNPSTRPAHTQGAVTQALISPKATRPSIRIICRKHGNTAGGRCGGHLVSGILCDQVGYSHDAESPEAQNGCRGESFVSVGTPRRVAGAFMWGGYTKGHLRPPYTYLM